MRGLRLRVVALISELVWSEQTECPFFILATGSRDRLWQTLRVNHALSLSKMKVKPVLKTDHDHHSPNAAHTK